MSTGTRAARAATSRQVKQELVRLLFGKQYARTGPEGHQMLDYSMYAYGDLKKAYLERAQEIHPDKNKSNNVVDKNSKHQFHELQDAWDKYEELAKAMKKVSSNTNGETPNFTMFGVGCSFADTEQERALRNEITDQACRGWFSSGSISATSSGSIHDDEETTPIYFKAVSLVDEDMFEEVSEDHSREKDGKERSRLSTLIPGWKRQ
jgi:DnaJ-class molecular chaperone